MTAIPVFPRRLFSQNHIYVNAKAGIHTPRDLIGKRVGLWAFQVTMSVLAKGDLRFHYGVPWEQIHWVTAHAEEIPLSFENLPISRAPEGADISRMLVEGELDALISPLPSALVQDHAGGIRRLFPDVRAECRDYFSRHGDYPIMHLLAIKQEVADALPDLPRQMMQAWEASKAMAYQFYDDPGYAVLAFARNEYEAQREGFGADLWPSGLAVNRRNLERFIGYMLDQRLLSARLPVETMFHPSVLET
jgi:4,5-dihydroxyphthalate decarboxylase